jgi:hypothetical protein
MTKQELLQLMRLLSALESALMYDRQASTRIPDYLLEDLQVCTGLLEREILK